MSESKEERLRRLAGEMVEFETRRLREREADARRIIALLCLKCGPFRFRCGESDLESGSGFSIEHDEKTGEWEIGYLSPEELRRRQEEHAARSGLATMDAGELAQAAARGERGAREEQDRRSKILRLPRPGQ